MQFIFAIALCPLVIFTSCDTSGDRYDDFQVGLDIVVPVSNFEVATNGLEATFTNLSTNGDIYVWDFGENGESISTEENPVFTYEEVGTYTISLTTTSVDKATNIYEFELSFLDVDFSTLSNINDTNVSFTNMSISAVSYLWDFGDGTTSEEESPDHDFGNFGRYSVTLTTLDSFGNEKFITKEVIVAGEGSGSFEAEIINGDASGNTSAWSINPDNGSGFNFWENVALETVVELFDNGQSKPSTSAGTFNIESPSFQIDNQSKRLYQPIIVQETVEYKITGFVKNSGLTAGELVGTFYVLSSEPQDETDASLATGQLAKMEVSALGSDDWNEVTIDFTVDSTFSFSEDALGNQNDNIDTITIDDKWVFIYFVPNDSIATSNTIFIDDLTIATKGFDGF